MVPHCVFSWSAAQGVAAHAPCAPTPVHLASPPFHATGDKPMPAVARHGQRPLCIIRDPSPCIVSPQPTGSHDRHPTAYRPAVHPRPTTSPSSRTVFPMLFILRIITPPAPSALRHPHTQAVGRPTPSIPCPRMTGPARACCNTPSRPHVCRPLLVSYAPSARHCLPDTLVRGGLWPLLPA